MKDMQAGPDLGLHKTQDGDRTLVLPDDGTDQDQSLQDTTKSDGKSNNSESTRTQDAFPVSGKNSQMDEQAAADATALPARPQQLAQSTSNRPTQSFEPNDVACSMCARTFPRLADRDRHFKTVHSNNGERPWKCTILGCPADVQTWAAPNGLRKHNKAWHGPYSCDKLGCSRRAPNGFSSMPELQQHTTHEHSEQMSYVGPKLSTQREPASGAARTDSAMSYSRQDRREPRDPVSEPSSSRLNATGDYGYDYRNNVAETPRTDPQHPTQPGGGFGTSTTAGGENRRDQKSHRQSRSLAIREHVCQYPQPWSDWIWDRENQYSFRRREVAFDIFDYKSQDKDHNPITVPSTSFKNKSPSTLARVSADTVQYEWQYNTNRGPVDSLTNDTMLESRNGLNIPPPQAHVTAKNPVEFSEEFDPNYKTHQQWEFKWGRVFKILWSEPSGSQDKGGTVISERTGRWGQKFTEKVRRFVVIDNRKGHCICLPIMTYGGQGCLKRGVHAEDHAIIYTTPQPARFAGEDGMTKKPIKVKQYSPQHKLEAASRLNYAKVYTVEYNVKVWFIGEIHKNSEWWLTAAYNEAHPPLKARGIAPSFLSGGPSASYSLSSGADSFNPSQYVQNTLTSTFGEEPLYRSTDAPLYPSRPYYPRKDSYGPSEIGYPSSGQRNEISTSKSGVDYPGRNHEDSYISQDQQSKRRDYDDDLYNA